jgi:hypothetical protein
MLCKTGSLMHHVAASASAHMLGRDLMGTVHEVCTFNCVSGFNPERPLGCLYKNFSCCARPGASCTIELPVVSAPLLGGDIMVTVHEVCNFPHVPVLNPEPPLALPSSRISFVFCGTWGLMHHVAASGFSPSAGWRHHGHGARGGSFPHVPGYNPEPPLSLVLVYFSPLGRKTWGLMRVLGADDPGHLG